MSQVKGFNIYKVITGCYVITLHCAFGQTIEVRYRIAQKFDGENFDEFDKWLVIHQSFPC